MTNLPKDGFEGVDYDFINDAGVPDEFKDKLARLRQEMDALLAMQKTQVGQAQANIAVLLSWATVATEAVKALESLIPLIPDGFEPKAGGPQITTEDKNCLLTKLNDVVKGLGGENNLDGVIQLLKKFA